MQIALYIQSQTYPQCNWLRFQPVLFCVCSIAFILLCISIEIMVDQLVKITSEYEERLRRCQYVPRLSFGRRMLRDDDGPNRYFLMYLFCEQSMAVQYLKDIGLLRSKMQCNTRGRDMTWSADSFRSSPPLSGTTTLYTHHP